MDNEFQTLKFRTKSGAIDEIEIGELLEIDGVSLAQYFSAETVEPQPAADPFLDRIIIDLQQQLAALTQRVSQLEGAPQS